MQKISQNRLILGIVMLCAFVLLRIIMRITLNVPYDFMPLATLALFSAVMTGRNMRALALPLIAVFASDAALSVFHQTPTPIFYAGFYWQYIAYSLIALLGFAFKQRVTIPNVALFSLSGAIIFYGVSNFGVWTTGLLYPMTLHGLATCFVMGIPFFKLSALSDLFYGYAFFAVIRVIKTQPNTHITLT